MIFSIHILHIIIKEIQGRFYENNNLKSSCLVDHGYVSLEPGEYANITVPKEKNLADRLIYPADSTLRKIIGIIGYAGMISENQYGLNIIHVHGDNTIELQYHAIDEKPEYFGCYLNPHEITPKKITFDMKQRHKIA